MNKAATSRVIETDETKRVFLKYFENYHMPFTVTITKGKKRSVAQNKLQRMWMNEISEQLGDQTPEEVRGYCKLTIGVPILRSQNDFFREKYDGTIRGLDYVQKIAIMMEPLDLPVTRIMTTVQKKDYLDGIVRHFSEKGIVLTDPEERP